jgi:SAM-dependent methyltransferase
MNELETTRVKELWGSTEGTWRTSERAHWLQHPKVQERINFLLTGNPGKDRYQYFAEHYYRAPLGGRKRVKCALTLGCGHGEFERCISQHNFAELHEAVDLADGAVAEATRLAKAEGLDHIRYRVADLNTIELPECTYDTVFGISSIHHVANLEHLFLQIQLSLKPDGLFVLDEYIGASKFQWPDEQIAIINDELAKLPNELKRSISNSTIVRGPIGRPTLQEMDASDPSEAVRSGEIMRLLPWFFDIVEVKGYGGTLLHMLLHEIAGNFVLDDPQSMDYLRYFFDLEDQMIVSGKFQHDFAIIIARRKPTRVEKVMGRKVAYSITNTRAKAAYIVTNTRANAAYVVTNTRAMLRTVRCKVRLRTRLRKLLGWRNRVIGALTL